jgi:hypothetical protein
MLHLVGVRELLCNNCNLEFKAFTLGRQPRRTTSDKQEISCNRRRGRRFDAKLPAQVAVILTEDRAGGGQYSSILQGHTSNVSKLGIALVLPAVRVDGHHLMPKSVGHNRSLWVRLSLASGLVTMRVTPIHSEALRHPSGSHLVGAQIKSIYQDDQTRYLDYIDQFEQSAV